MRRLTLVITALVAASCASVPLPTSAPVATPLPSPWGAGVATADPSAIAAQPVLGRTAETITLLPISPRGATVGVAYAYEMPHCGVGSPIDVDGSFWDALGVGSDPVTFDGQPGTFQLTSPTRATFTSTQGAVLELVRHDGGKAFQMCS